MKPNKTKPEDILWDRTIRVFHWLVAALFLLNYWVFEAGEPVHEYTGYTIAVLWLWRFMWGFVGSTHARFRDFWPTPTRLKSYWCATDKAQYYKGHNPIGALMIIFMLGLLFIIPLSGYLQETDRFWGEPWPQQLHELASHLLMVAVVVHIVSVLFIQHRTGLAFVKPMLTGKRSKRVSC